MIMKVPFLELKKQYESIKTEINDAIQKVIDRTAFAGGPFVESFEKAFATFCRCDHVVGVGSGTEALWLSLLALGIDPGDEVITVPNTFIATAEAIVMAGAKLILVDVYEDSALIDIEKVHTAITPRTKAIIPIHLFGQCCDMDSLMELAREKKIRIIEDACQAHGATYKGMKAGSLGHAAAFSFYPSKNLGAFGEGGAVTTNDSELFKRIKALRHHAQFEKNVHAEIGYNYRLDSIQAAVLRVKLKYLDEWNSYLMKELPSSKADFKYGYNPEDSHKSFHRK